MKLINKLILPKEAHSVEDHLAQTCNQVLSRRQVLITKIKRKQTKIGYEYFD